MWPSAGRAGHHRAVQTHAIPGPFPSLHSARERVGSRSDRPFDGYEGMIDRVLLRSTSLVDQPDLCTKHRDE